MPVRILQLCYNGRTMFASILILSFSLFSSTVYVDAANSVGDVPPVGALVSVDGADEMVVRSVSPCYGMGGRLHHTELVVG